MKRYILIIALLFYGNAVAQDVSLNLYPEMTLNATYLEGDEGKPVVIIVHGFLQTKDFPTVARLAEGLNFSGYHVLAPTLSLGIDDRKVSQKCSAIQFHSMPDTSKEIGLWVQWLKAKGHKQIELLGHSFGNLNLVAYTSAIENDEERKLIKGLTLISLTSLHSDKQKELDDRAKRDMKVSPFRPGAYELIHCHPYKTIPEMYLSYTHWGPQAVANALKRQQLPIRVILGTEDKRVNEVPDPDFYNRLARQGAALVRIEGANHFFDEEFGDVLTNKVLGLIGENG